MSGYSIGEVAERSGLSRSTLRYYESVGVIRTPARRHGRRRYSKGIFRELALVAAAKRAAFTLEEIRRLRRHEERGMGLSEAWAEVAGSKRGTALELTRTAARILSTLGRADRCGCESLRDCALIGELERDQRASP